jgi:F-box/leucine-rich repeat protein 2/20
MAYCTKLEKLSLKCPCLRELYLDKCRTLSADSVLSIFDHSRNIKKLDLRRCGANLNEEALTRMTSHLRNLQTFKLSWCPAVSCAFVEQVLLNCVNLKSLLLQMCRNVGSELLELVANHCPNLEKLNVAGCLPVTDEAIPLLGERCLFTMYPLSNPIHYVSPI